MTESRMCFAYWKSHLNFSLNLTICLRTNPVVCSKSGRDSFNRTTRKEKKNVWPIHHVQQQLVRAFLLVAEGVNIFYPVTFASGIELQPLCSELSRGVSATWAGNSHKARVCETIENSNKFEITDDVIAFKNKELTWPWPLSSKVPKGMIPSP